MNFIILLSSFQLFIFFDGLWLFYNTKFSDGLYFFLVPKFDTSRRNSLICSISCWLIGAIYINGHIGRNQDLPIAFAEGAWLGSLIYGIYNFTTSVVAPYWSEKLWVPIIDTMWGSVLFGTVNVVAEGCYFNTDLNAEAIINFVLLAFFIAVGLTVVVYTKFIKGSRWDIKSISDFIYYSPLPV